MVADNTNEAAMGPGIAEALYSRGPKSINIDNVTHLVVKPGSPVSADC